jgi:hypothetical protein
MMSPTARDTLQVIDKQKLAVVAQVRPGNRARPSPTWSSTAGAVT